MVCSSCFHVTGWLTTLPTTVNDLNSLLSSRTYCDIFSVFISLGALYIIRTGLNYLLVTKDIWPEAESVQKAFTFNHIVAVILGELYVLALVTAIKLNVDCNKIRKIFFTE